MKANESLWSATSTMPAFAPIPMDEEVDVAIVGGGITGLTAALLLAEAGKQVALVEARTLGSGVSHRSTTHLTEAIDTRYFELESDFGAEGARLVAESSRAAIEKVEGIIGAHSIACGYLARPGFLYADREDDVDALARWSAQVEEPVDGLPFIGRSSASEHVLVATGFSGNGITFGTVAAMITKDLVLGNASPWAELYTATRIKPVASAATYVSENVDFPLHFISDHVRPAEAKSLDEVGLGEGKTVRVNGRRLAVYREPDGKLHALSSVCPHLGCTVKFNPAERSWDCPCHGSRFAIDGTVLDGPSVRGLQPAKL